MIFDETPAKMSLTSELLELSQHLQQEHLFVTTEREQLQRLFHNVTQLSERVFHTAWIARQQKLNMQQFIDQGNMAGISTEVYSSNNQLEETNFMDSYKVFSYHDTKYGELLKFLHENPTLLSQLIVEGEKAGGLNMPKIVSIAVTSLYGNCILQEDEQGVLQLLKSLLHSQVANNDNPRRLMRRQTMSFSLVYKHLCDILFSARLFLTAALYDPIMRLLMEDEWFYDIDPDKAMERFPPAEKQRRFGEPGTEENVQKQAQYRKYIVDKLVMLAERFIKNIKANIHCFPPSLGWLISQVYRVLTERGQVNMQEVRATCADLVFALFICPAICDPEPHGITSDVPISHIARHNLMQMAQIIQALAISHLEEMDVKVRDLYSRFDKGCMASVLDLFLEGPWEDMTNQTTIGPASTTGTVRSAVLLTADDVRLLIGFLRNTSSKLDDKNPHKKSLEQMLTGLPADVLPTASDMLNIPGGSGVISPPTGSVASADSGGSPGTPSSERKPLFKTKGHRKKRSSTHVEPRLEEVLAEHGVDGENKSKPCNEVLVVSIYSPGDCPGLLPEKKVLSMIASPKAKASPPPHHPTPSSDRASGAAPTPPAPNPEIQEKRTRFSLSHDQESIGNASDYQEVISEAASSHSVEDEENELETDNFSDMMSANVSGRGSPSISGRDTPLSQAGSVEENPPAAPQLPVPVPETVRKENRVDVTERFGKFEIKAELAMEREECKSTVSDTWSTDVLASDSEPPEQNQVDRLEEVAEEMPRPLFLGSEPISEISETASDAWSTDVLASDTDEKHSELLKDLEQDLNLEREEGDNSLGNEEGDDNQLDLDALGAMGGPMQDAGDNFSDVFGDVPQLAMKQGEEGEKGSKKISSIVHHFQSGPNLQLPTVHRQQSQSLKNAEGRVNTVLNSLEGGGTNGGVGSAAASPTGASSVTVIHSSSGGARSKVRDSGRKKDRKGSSSSSTGGGSGGHGAGGDDSGVGNLTDFDPLTPTGSGGGGGGGSSSSGRRFKDRWPWNKAGKQSSVEGLSQGDAGNQGSPPMTSTSGSMPPDALSEANRGQSHSGSRDSGIDIWVNTNGQMSGNSQRTSPSSGSLIGARASLDSSMSPRLSSTAPPLPGRASLDSNLQRLNALGGVAGITSTPDSGLHSSSYLSSSIDTSTPPLEIDNPLFHFETNENRAGNRSQTSAFSSEITSQQAGGSMATTESFLLMDDDVPCPMISQEELSKRNRKLRRSTPQIEVTDIFKKISIIEGEQEEHSDSETPNMGQQQISNNLSERRLSSALNSFDPFSGDNDDQSLNGDIIPISSIAKDLTISFADTQVLTQDDNNTDDDDAFLLSGREGSDVGESMSKASVDAEGDLKKSEETGSGHCRQDSSGSSQSANSFKLNVAGEAKDSSGDNVSILSSEKDYLEPEDAANVKGKKSGPGFLRSVRDKFNKGMKRKNTKMEKDLNDTLPDTDVGNAGTGTLKDSGSAGNIKEVTTLQTTESTDDILAKYRSPKKAVTIAGNNNSSTTINNNISGKDDAQSSYPTSANGASGGDSEVPGIRPQLSRNPGSISDSNSHIVDDASPPYFDRNNLECCPAFEDAKKKLRMVLSTGDIYFGLNQVQSSSPREGLSSRENELIHLLNAQLAEAINLQNKELVTRLYEVIRCVRMFDADGCKKLLRAMQDDYRSRASYISYLIRSRQGLLVTRSHLQRLLSRVKRDKEICSKHLTNICARNFLEKREKKMWRFISEFQKLSMSDEKIDHVEQFLQDLYQEMSTDVLWKAATESQLEDGQQAVERFLMSRIYTHAMFPNGDGDIMRDQVLQEHLRKLGRVISPNHKDLRIPHMYHAECPWPAAQKEIYKINAYRTPKDKLQCVLRCSQTIMSLLSMANEKSVPAADDFMPVLIFVLIKANPFGLLSTIQYVNSFYETRLHGEEQYWWLQLTSAVEFIKTMDYSQ